MDRSRRLSMHAALLALAAGGCINPLFNERVCLKVVPGRTTRAEVRSLLWGQLYWGDEDSVNICSGTLVVHEKDLHVTFDEAGVVDDVGYTFFWEASFSRRDWLGFDRVAPVICFRYGQTSLDDVVGALGFPNRYDAGLRGYWLGYAYWIPRRPGQTGWPIERWRLSFDSNRRLHWIGRPAGDPVRILTREEVEARVRVGRTTRCDLFYEFGLPERLGRPRWWYLAARATPPDWERVVFAFDSAGRVQTVEYEPTHAGPSLNAWVGRQAPGRDPEREARLGARIEAIWTLLAHYRAAAGARDVGELTGEHVAHAGQRSASQTRSLARLRALFARPDFGSSRMDASSLILTLYAPEATDDVTFRNQARRDPDTGRLVGWDYGPERMYVRRATDQLPSDFVCVEFDVRFSERELAHVTILGRYRAGLVTVDSIDYETAVAGDAP